MSSLLIPDRKLIVPSRCRRCGKLLCSNRLYDRMRTVPRWGRPREVFNAGNYAQVGSDNAARVKDNGLVVAGDSDPCCCAPPCSTCANISGAVVTFSGITACTCSDGGLGLTSEKLVIDPNNSYSLPGFSLSGFNCTSVLTVTNSHNSYSGSGCSGSPTARNSTITLTWVSATQKWGLSWTAGFSDTNADVFSALVSGATTICTLGSTLNFTNTFTTCPGSGNAAKDGSATVVFAYV